MKSLGVAQYGPPTNIEARRLAQPEKPTARNMLVKTRAISVNPIDCKVRGGIYDDAPDYYDHVPKPFHVIGFEGSGSVVEVGPDVTTFKPGDAIFFLQGPGRQGAASEHILVDEGSAARKPWNLDWLEAAAMPLTYGTAYECLVQGLGIQQGEQAGLLVINGAGGVGSMASQIARRVLNLPVVITTAGRPETVEWSKKMGATHVLDHHADLRPQIKDLKLTVPIKYIFIVHSTKKYLATCADIIAPYGKICTVVQDDVQLYGTQMMSKSVSFVPWWLGTRMYHKYEQEKSGTMMAELGRFCEDGTITPHLTRRLKLNKDGLQEAHRLIESGTMIGKLALGVDEPGEPGAFE